jgi:hypothetical protein
MMLRYLETFKRRTFLTLLVFVLAGLGGVFVHGGSSGLPRPGFDRVGAAGVTAALPANDPLLMRARKNNDATGEPRLLAIRGLHAFYRIGTAPGRDCYGIGPASSPEIRLDVLQCHRDFPSQDYPVLTFITVARVNEPREAKIIHAEGIAADGVAAVAFKTPDGRYLARTQVESNVYRIANIPTGELSAFVAFSGSGDLVYSQRVP